MSTFVNYLQTPTSDKLDTTKVYGGLKDVIKSNKFVGEENQARRERQGEPVFDIVIELQPDGSVKIIRDVASAVDNIQAGRADKVIVEHRSLFETSASKQKDIFFVKNGKFR